MNVVLMGYRGSGKSTLGRMLAERLGKPFADTDDLTVERLACRSIAEAWDEYGEAGWRRAEATITGELMETGGQVISLGGGTVIQPQARAIIQANPRNFYIYLRCEAAELYRRIKADPKFSLHRPNIFELGGNVHQVRVTLARREPIYMSLANHIIDVTSTPPDEALIELLKVIERADRQADTAS
jgi:shikimate kinase